MLHLQILFHYSVGSVRDVVHNDVQINFIRFVTIRVEGLTHLDTIGMVQHLQNLKLSVLVALVLKDFLDGHSLSGFRDSCFKYNSERTISDNLLCVVSEALLKTKKFSNLNLNPLKVNTAMHIFSGLEVFLYLPHSACPLST